MTLIPGRVYKKKPEWYDNIIEKRRMLKSNPNRIATYVGEELVTGLDDTEIEAEGHAAMETFLRETRSSHRLGFTSGIWNSTFQDLKTGEVFVDNDVQAWKLMGEIK